MAKFDKIAVLKKIGDTGMVPVFYNKDLFDAAGVTYRQYERSGRRIEIEL